MREAVSGGDGVEQCEGGVREPANPLKVRQTRVYAKWFAELRDKRAQGRIIERVRRLSTGNPGDHRFVGDGVSELRVDYGPGYRIYFCRKGAQILLLLCGGDKQTQDRDIERAKRIARDWTDE